MISEPGQDPRRIVAGGSITLGRKTLPGEYLLELEAIQTDGSRTAVSQWIDSSFDELLPGAGRSHLNFISPLARRVVPSRNQG